nr:MAG TPA: hypothetical protein [Caudoviricetes sp.]
MLSYCAVPWHNYTDNWRTVISANGSPSVLKCHRHILSDSW